MTFVLHSHDVSSQVIGKCGIIYAIGHVHIYVCGTKAIHYAKRV